MVKKKQNILEEELGNLERSIKKRNYLFAFVIVILLIVFYFFAINYNSSEEDVRGVLDIEEVIEIEEDVEDLTPEIYIKEDVIEETNNVRIDITRGIVNRVLTNTFEPNGVIINQEDVVEWHVLDKRRHKISCYMIKDNWRIFMSENIYDGDKIETKFKETGEYLCVDMIYGARGYITVK